MITPALLLYALGMTILGVGGSHAVLALAGLATGLGHGIGYPVMLALSSLRTTPGDRGASTAIFTAIFDLALIGMAPVLGVTISMFGYRSMFWATAVTIVIGLIVVRRLDLKAESTTSPTPSP
jgi:MFS family permease